MNYKNQKGVVGLITVFGVGLFALSVALTASSGILVEMAKNRNTTLGSQAFYTAEAGMKEGVYQYSGNNSYTGGALTMLNNTDSGSISLETINEIRSIVKASAGRETNNRTVSGIIELYPNLSTKYSVYSGANLNISGIASIEGNAFANNNATISGISSVDGDLIARNNLSIIGLPTVSGETLCGACGDSVTPVPAPTIDTDAYRQEAISSGTYFINTAAAAAFIQSGVPINTVVFVENPGTLVLNGISEMSGSLYTTGSVVINGVHTINTTTGFASVVIEGNLNAIGILNAGVVYVNGWSTFTGSSSIEGALIALGGTTITGLAEVIFTPQTVALWQDTAIPSPIKPAFTYWEEE
jgi:hypothetical protein